jgi:hypothetical protein
MRNMILRGVPGLYVFHRDEEIGGKGSTFIAHETPNLLREIKMAIAFDRKGYDSIITHQMSARCASNAFAESMASQLPAGMKADANGIYTDTANYVDIIPECSNLSVGYHSAHSAQEWQSGVFALSLLDSMLRFDWTRVTVARDPTEIDDDDYWNRWGADLWSNDERKTGCRGARRSDYTNGMTLAEILEFYPDEAAEALERWGFTEADLLDEMRLSRRR